MGDYVKVITGVLVLTALSGALFSVLYSTYEYGVQDVHTRATETDSKANMILSLDGADWIIAGNDSSKKYTL